MSIITEIQDLRKVTKEIKTHEKKVNLEVVSSPDKHETSSKETANPTWHHLTEIFKQCHEFDAVHYMELHAGIANKRQINFIT